MVRFGGWVLGALILVAVTAAVTLLLGGGAEIAQPPGCQPEDRDYPGCRPTKNGSGQTVALVTVIATPLAAAVVAVIGLLSAQRRHEEEMSAASARLKDQLEQEGVRLSTQLEAERKRLARQLESERGLRDLEELRLLLDEAAETLGALGQLIADAKPATAAAPPFDDDESQLFNKRIRDLTDRIPAAIRLKERLAIRLGPDDEIFRAYNRTLRGMMDAQKELSSARPIDAAAVERLDEAYGRTNEQHREFVQQAHECARVQLAEAGVRGDGDDVA